MATESLTAKIAGKIAGSDDNQSGLISELNLFLKSGGLQTLETRAQGKGLADTLAGWRNDEHPESTSAETIEALFEPAEIAAFSEKTGQNEGGVISALANQLPRRISKISH